MTRAIENGQTELLARALLALETREDCYRLLSDLCTVREVLDMGQRIEVARLLSEKVTYTEIARKTGASTATISRVNRSLLYGEGGYGRILARIGAGDD